MAVESIRDLLSAEAREVLEPDHGDDLRETLQNPVQSPPARTHTEDRLGALLPGDSQEGHLLAHEPVEYMDVPFTELLGRLKAGGLSLDEERRVRRALKYQRRFHQGGVSKISPAGRAMDPPPKRQY